MKLARGFQTALMDVRDAKECAEEINACVTNFENMQHVLDDSILRLQALHTREEAQKRRER